MSIDTENQNTTQAPAPATASDQKGKGKEKEVDPPVLEDASDAEESGDDTWDDYPFERFPSPPPDESDATLPAVPNAAAASLNPPLDPPLMTFVYPPPPPLANDPTWYAQMVADVHRNRAHLNAQLDLAHTEAADALADATLADIEHKAEIHEMQKFLNRLASVAGKNFVRKLIRSVQWALEHRGADFEEGNEDEHQDADDENSSRSDEGEVDQQDKEDDNLRGSAGESEEDPQDAEEEEYSDDGNSRRRSQSPSPSSPDWRRSSFHESALCAANPQGMPETPPQNGRRKLTFQEILSQPSSPDCPREDVDYTDDEYSGGSDDVSWGWTESPPAHESRKRQLEEEEEESSSPETSPRKKIKLESPPPPHTLVALPSQSLSAPEDDQDNAIGSDADSDEEYDVENSLTIEHEPIPPAASLYLYKLERNPYRVRQNSRGAPELYVPGRLAIDLP